jgi:hypothetical protein
MKRATRYKAEVVDVNGVVAWEILVHDLPTRALTLALQQCGFIVRKSSSSKTDFPPALVFSDLDPRNSVLAAREFSGRQKTKTTAALELLLARRGQWVSEEEVRRAAGSSGDRRVRELRGPGGWPIEKRQLAPGEAWHWRLNLPVDAEGPTSLF